MEGGPLTSPPSNGHAPTPPRTPQPLVKSLRGAPAKTPHAQAEPELSGTADICPVSAADICPVSTADICPVSTEDIYPVSTGDRAAAGRRPAAVLSSVLESSGLPSACGAYEEAPAGD